MINGMSAENSKPTILVVEDEKPLREFFVFDLQAAGFDVVDAEDGEMGLQMIRSMPISLVICDINLPKKSGIEILQEVRMGSRSVNPIFLMISGRLDLPLEEAHHLGINAFFEKPFSRHILIDAVNRLMMPEEKRWRPEVAAKYYPKRALVGELEITLESYQAAVEGKLMHFGQGGMFVAIPEGLPQVGDFLGFKINFEDEPNQTLEGEGVVKWTREAPVGDSPSGLGLELVTLKAESLYFFQELRNKFPNIAYIPKV